MRIDQTAVSTIVLSSMLRTLTVTSAFTKSTISRNLRSQNFQKIRTKNRYFSFKSSYDVENASQGITGSYNPAEFESNVYEWWEKSGCFDPDAVHKNLGDGGKSEQPAYVLPMPPVGRKYVYRTIYDLFW